MIKFTDRIWIFFLMVFAMAKLFAGRYLIVVIYITLSITFFSYTLVCRIEGDRSLKEKKRSRFFLFFVQFFSLLLPFFSPALVVIIPVIVYDLFVVKNYCGMVLAAWSLFYAGSKGVPLFWCIYTGVLSFISCYLSVRAVRWEKLTYHYKKLRDEFSVKEEKLKEQHYELMEMKEQETYMAQLKERNRIAREIHDHVGHTLTRAILQLGALFTIYKEEPLHSQLSDLKETLDLSMNNIRAGVHDLHDESIDLEMAFLQITEPLKERYTLELETDFENNISGDLKNVVIGVVKEAVSNIIKHSTNDTVRITFREHPSMYQLVICDYMQGEQGRSVPDFEYEDQRGMGLANIENRVYSVGGKVQISKGKEFRIFITIPRKSTNEKGTGGLV